VFRHKVNDVYEVNYLGGTIRTTGNHSVFVRTQGGVKPKIVSGLVPGDCLIDIPYVANRTNNLREIRAHNFDNEFNLELSVYDPVFANSEVSQRAYDYAIANQYTMSQSDISQELSVSQTTISKWQRTMQMPRILSKLYFKHSLPEKVLITPVLMRLMGYYAAEGYSRKEVDFCFNIKETEKVNDVKNLMKNIFGVSVDREIIRGNAINVIFYSKPLAKFFEIHCGKGSYKKHIPEFLFEAPKDYFTEFFRGYFNGDGHKDKRGRLEITSVSKQIIMELNWLSRMHGFKSYVHSFTTREGRVINGGKPLHASVAWRLGFGKTQNPLEKTLGKASIKRPVVRSVKKIPYSGYVYDFCGCDNEAFFGGVTPLLLHNTNRPDVLDPALLRPGRFDRRVTLDLPDRKDREAILTVHSTEKPFAEDVNLQVIAERTSGFSGADLYSLMNEGAILAARENRTKVSQYDLIRSIEKVMLGPERRSHILSKKEKEITAYHEAGHAVVASILPYADPVHKISIISRGRALGYVLHLPFEDRKLQSKKEFLDDIAVSLGGYVTEKMLFNDLTTGPSNDLQVSTALARDMVTKYGMSDMLGPVALEGQGGKVLFGRGVEEKEYSEKVGADIDAEVSRIMREAHDKAEKVIAENKPLLDAIAKRLIETETIERAEFENILIANGVTPKKKLDIEHQV